MSTKKENLLAWEAQGPKEEQLAIRQPTLSRSKALKVGTPIRSTAARNLPTLSVEASSSRAPGQIFLSSAQSSLPPASAACRSLSEASDGVGRGTSGNTPRSHPTASARRLAAR